MGEGTSDIFTIISLLHQRMIWVGADSVRKFVGMRSHRKKGEKHLVQARSLLFLRRMEPFYDNRQPRISLGLVAGVVETYWPTSIGHHHS